MTSPGQPTALDGSAPAAGGPFPPRGPPVKLLGYRHASPEPMTSFQVSNRERVSGLLYDQDQAPEVHFRLALAMAHHQGTVTQLEHHLEAELAVHERDRPPPPELPSKIRTALRHER